MVTDFVRYKPIIIFEALSYTIVWGLLIYGQNLKSLIVIINFLCSLNQASLNIIFAIFTAVIIINNDINNLSQIVEIFYGLGASAHVAYSTYIYSKVDKRHYKIVTSHNNTASLIGKFLGGVVGQACVSFHLLNLHELNYISFVCSSIALLAALFLPNAQKSSYFHPVPSYSSLPAVKTIKHVDHEDRYHCKSAFRLLWNDFKCAYSQPYVLKWSLWWALACAGQFQVVNYIQVLWEHIATDEVRYNGVVKSIHTLLSKY